MERRLLSGKIENMTSLCLFFPDKYSDLQDKYSVIRDENKRLERILDEMQKQQKPEVKSNDGENATSKANLNIIRIY